MEFTLRSVAYGSYYRYSIPMLQSSPTERRITMTKGKHLTLENRIAIASGLNEHMSFKAIALRIGKDCTTVSKEIKLHVSTRRESPRYKTYNNCKHRFGCKEAHLCDSYKCLTPRKSNRCCSCNLCNDICPKYEPHICELLSKPPYVCNGCSKRHTTCTLLKYIYDPKSAQATYELVLKETRSGITYTQEEIVSINKIVTPLINKGQSPHHICINHSDELMLSESTLYRLIDLKLLDVRNIDLPRKVRYAVRQKSNPYKVDKKCRVGRTYADYESYMVTHPILPVTEMDTVEGKKGGKVLLTLHFVRAEFMLAFIRDRNDSQSVIDIINYIYNTVGFESFTATIPLILTDNGSEFSNPFAIECDSDGVIRTRIFYCDPSSPHQKGSAEVNHEMIRRFIPKGTSFDHLVQSDISLMMNNINSHCRRSLGNKCPYDVMAFLYGNEFLDALGCIKISPDDVTMNSSIFSKEVTNA